MTKGSLRDSFYQTAATTKLEWMAFAPQGKSDLKQNPNQCMWQQVLQWHVFFFSCGFGAGLGFLSVEVRK